MDFEKLERELRNDRLQEDMKGFATVVTGFYTGCKEHKGVTIVDAQMFASYLVSAMFEAKNSESETKKMKSDDEKENKPDLKEIEKQQKSFADMVCSYYLECLSKKNITLGEARALTKSFIFGLFSGLN